MQNNGLQQVYDEATQRVEAAYRAFRAGYEVMKPPPQSPESKRFLFGVKQYGMFAGLIGSVIVSASHTIPVFLGLKSVGEINLTSFEFIVGMAIFVMIEMSVIVFAYSATESEGNTDTAHRVRSFTRGGMWFIVTIAVLANVYYVLAANINIPSQGFIAVSWEWIRVAIFLLIGTSAPVIAFMTGDILAIDVLKHNSKNRRDMQMYEEAFKEWNNGLAASWAAQKNRWGGSVNINVSKPENVYLSAQTDSRQTQSGASYNRVSSATDTAYEWLLANPDSQNKPVRELAEIIGVGKDSVAKAKRRVMGSAEE
jgi:hypothetical protein